METAPERAPRRASKQDLPPDIDKLPDGALLTRRQTAAYSGFTEAALKKWAREGRGPALIYVEGRPRTTVRDLRAWIDGKRPAVQGSFG